VTPPGALFVPQNAKKDDFARSSAIKTVHSGFRYIGKSDLDEDDPVFGITFQTGRGLHAPG
jgi:hypothetical protein